MSFRISEQDGRLLLKISGGLNCGTVTKIRPEIDQLAKQPEEVVIDASELENLDSAGVACLVMLYKAKRAQGLELWIEGLHEQPLTIFRLLRMDRMVKLGAPSAPAAAATTVPKLSESLLPNPIERWRMVFDVSERMEHARNRGIGATLLLGAGCSVTANIPTAAGVAALIANMYPKAARRASRYEYGPLMQALEIGERHDVIAGLVAQARLNPTHEIVAELVKKRFVDRILTTNFDGLVLKACLHAGVQIFDYDLSDMRMYEPGLVRSPAVFFLHGRDGGFLQFHTEPEMLSHAPLLAPVIEDAISRRPVIVVGYSGADPIFNLLTAKKRYVYGLFWVHYGDVIPEGKVLTDLITSSEGAYFILAGGGSDDFFSQLASYLLASSH